MKANSKPLSTQETSTVVYLITQELKRSARSTSPHMLRYRQELQAIADKLTSAATVAA